MNIEPYNFENAERLRYGNYPVLDTIVYRWARKVETVLFNKFRQELYAGSSVVEEMRFSSFLASLQGPRPIYFLQMEPFQGTGLLVLDNRFANMTLQEGEHQPTEKNQLAPHNQLQLQSVVQEFLAQFDHCWADIHPVTCRLKKITTYLFRARILNPYEPCLVAEIHLAGQQVSSRLKLCLPRTMLEPVMDLLGHRKVVPSMVHGVQTPALKRPRVESLPHNINVRMGQVKPVLLRGDLKVGSLLPIHSEVGQRATVEINGVPMLVGEVGEVEGRYAVRVTGHYHDVREHLRRNPGEFHQLQWPSA